MKEKMYKIGKIVNTHGIRGEIKVVRISDFDDRFEAGKTVYVVRENKEPLPLVIKTHRIHKGFDLLLLEGYNSINEVEGFKGASLQIKEDQLTELDENEYYYHEIIGCAVFSTANEQIGVIKEILSPGANDVWVVQRPGQKDLLIPYIAEVVLEVDPHEKKVVIQPMEGLLD